MNKLLKELQPEALSSLAQYFDRMAAMAREEARLRTMSEVCCQRATLWHLLRSAAENAAKLPTPDALALIRQVSPEVTAEQAEAHLTLARRKLKRKCLEERNAQIAAMTLHGHSNSAIAAAAGCSVATAAKVAAKSKGERR